jgi:hypothetical protein
VVNALRVPQDDPIWGVAAVRELRVVLVRVPPFLADLIRHVIAPRFEQRRLEQCGGRPMAEPLGAALSIVSEISDTPDIRELIERMAPHVVILGSAAAVSLGAEAPLPSDVRVLTLSRDLTRVYGPGQGDSATFTPDVLADRLLDIAETI